jgi:hypothetical protein
VFFFFFFFVFVFYSFELFSADYVRKVNLDTIAVPEKFFPSDLVDGSTSLSAKCPEIGFTSMLKLLQIHRHFFSFYASITDLHWLHIIK